MNRVTLSNVKHPAIKNILRINKKITQNNQRLIQKAIMVGRIMVLLQITLERSSLTVVLSHSILWETPRVKNSLPVELK